MLKKFSSACFNQYNLGNHAPCLIGPKFHASEPSGSEEDFLIFFLCISMVQAQNPSEVFEYFSMYFYASNTGFPGAGPFWIMGPLSERTW